ncbi:MAG TPA: ABC transporter permease [Tepidisphaeraceae bacterium]|nr:ABC transporter permease [Tepidisphaeraceae bacterium]
MIVSRWRCATRSVCDNAPAMLVARLAFSNLLVRKARSLLTVAAVALSVSLVVSVTSGYASMEATIFRMLSTFFASVDARIIRQNDAQSGVPETLLQQVRADREVRSAVGRIEYASGLIDVEGRPIVNRNTIVIGVTRPEDHRVELMELRAGQWFDTSDGDVCVIDQVASLIIKDPSNTWGDESKPGVQVGDMIQLPSPDGNLSLRVIGIVHKPKILAALQPSVYVPIRTLQNWPATGAKGRFSAIWVDLDPNAEPAQFAGRWRAKLEEIDPVLKLKMASEQRGELDKNLRGLQVASYFGGAVSMLAAAFIVFSALSMGVNERQRSLAMMRAIGAHKGQLAHLVVIEALLLAGFGVALGIPLGLLWLLMLKWLFSDVLIAGIYLSYGGLLFAAGASALAAMSASILPAWGATRTEPLEAMVPLADGGKRNRAVAWAVPGLLLACADSLILFVSIRPLLQGLGIDQADRLAREFAFYAHLCIGLPCVMLGFFLIAPLMVLIVERMVGPIVAVMMRVRYPLLRQQLTGGIWRSAGTAAALMVGMAVFVVLQVQGNTVIGGWRIPDKFPDMFMTSFKLGGLTPADMEKIKSVPGVNPDEILPIAIASPEFGSSIFSIRGAAVMPEATMFFGLNPKLALEMMELEFRDGTEQQAVELMTTRRRHILVTEEFRQLKGLKTGDTLSLKTPRHGTVDYTIAGVVWSPGIDVMVSSFDLGKQFEQRTAASIFGTLEDARDDFGVEGVYLFALNVMPGIQKEQLADDIQKYVGAWGIQSGDVRVLKSIVQHQFRKLIFMVSMVAFSAMGVASLGVANTIMASVRSRLWQYGILRSIGVARGQLLRLVLAEAILLTVVGVMLGLLCGGLLAFNAKQLLLVMTGYDPPFSVPFGTIATGTAIVAVLAMLAGLWPAASVARRSRCSKPAVGQPEF